MKKLTITIVVSIIILLGIFSNCNVNAYQINKINYNIKNVNSGSLWQQINEDGFGDVCNVGPRGIAIFNNSVIIGTANFLTQTDDPYTIKFDKSVKIYQLLYGLCIKRSLGGKTYSSSGCEIWSYNGDSWEQLIGDSGIDGFSGGFNDVLNVGARTMIEYPKDSGTIWVGTWNMDFKNFDVFNGCEIWKSNIY